jgi:hypothetical protein
MLLTGPLTSIADSFNRLEGLTSCGARKSIRIKKRATNDTHNANTKPATEDLGAVAHNSSAEHSSKICNNLSDSDLVCREVILIAKHGRVKILRWSGKS